MDKLSERIETLEERLRQLRARQSRSALRQRTLQSRRERKDDTRRKILVGALVLAQVERGEVSQESLRNSLNEFLSRPHDRALFDLPPLPSPGRLNGVQQPIEDRGNGGVLSAGSKALRSV